MKTPETLEVAVTMIGDYYSMRVVVEVPVPENVADPFDRDEWWQEAALAKAVELIKSFYGWDIETTITDVDFEK